MAYTTYDVAHAWAHNLDKCHYGSSVSQDDGIMMSYSTAIAQHFTAPTGKKIFILSNRSYSNTTNKHQNAAVAAVPVGAIQFWSNDSYLGRRYFVHQDDKESLLRFGLRYVIGSYWNFLSLKSYSKKKEIADYDGYKMWLKWCDKVFGKDMTPYLLKCKIDEEFRHIVQDGSVDRKKLRKFIRLLSQNTPIEEICDALNGKGTWQAYRDRTKKFRDQDRRKKLSKYCGFTDGHNNYWHRDKVYSFLSVISGSITKADEMKHKKQGDWIEWLYNCRKVNIDMAINTHYIRETQDRKQDALYRLNRYLGCTWGCNRYIYGRPIPRVSVINYNGEDFDVSQIGAHEHPINMTEYKEFVALSDEEKKQWMYDKRQWMLETLKREVAEYQAWHQEYELRQIQEQEQREYVRQQIAEHGEHIKLDLWKQGYQVSLPHMTIEDFHGGNVLLRYNDKTLQVETSKGIKLPLEECRRLWPLVQRWHNNNTEFVKNSEVAHATYHDWEISGYQRDTLIAGCHAISYYEMSNMAKQLAL